VRFGDTGSPDAARTWTSVEDVADGALPVAIAIFVAAVTLREPSWVHVTSYVVAALSVIRGLGMDPDVRSCRGHEGGGTGMEGPRLFA
jgi:hypothetical protein